MPDDYGWRFMTPQETGIKAIPKKNKCKKAKWLSEKALQIAVKKKRSKKQGREGKYIQLTQISKD